MTQHLMTRTDRALAAAAVRAIADRVPVAPPGPAITLAETHVTARAAALYLRWFEPALRAHAAATRNGAEA